MVVTDGDGGHFVFFRRRRHRYLDHPHAQQAGPTGGVTNGAAPKCGQATRAVVKPSCPVLGFSRRDMNDCRLGLAVVRTLKKSIS